jgi:predicted MFS family arabinose efflux permease
MNEMPLQVIEKFIRFAYRQRYDGQNMTYEASTFLYAIAVAVFALGGMCGGFVGGWMANNFGRYNYSTYSSYSSFLSILLVLLSVLT